MAICISVIGCSERKKTLEQTGLSTVKIDTARVLRKINDPSRGTFRKDEQTKQKRRVSAHQLVLTTSLPYLFEKVLYVQVVG